MKPQRSAPHLLFGLESNQYPRWYELDSRLERRRCPSLDSLFSSSRFNNCTYLFVINIQVGFQLRVFSNCTLPPKGSARLANLSQNRDTSSSGGRTIGPFVAAVQEHCSRHRTGQHAQAVRTTNSQDIYWKALQRAERCLKSIRMKEFESRGPEMSRSVGKRMR